MKQVTEAIERVLRKMPDDELEMLVHYAEDRGLDGIVERGGETFRQLAEEETLELSMTLEEFISEANDVEGVVANIGIDILEEGE